jgi:hypothetical protein
MIEEIIRRSKVYELEGFKMVEGIARTSKAYEL